MKVTFRNLLKGATCKTEKRIDGELKEMLALVSLSQEKKCTECIFLSISTS
jgi:hypothetical protein